MKITKIYGPPGTGKTTTSISMLGSLLNNGYSPNQICYLSHTRAAAQEVIDRLKQQAVGGTLSKDYAWFRTIHSAACKQMGVAYHEIFSRADLRQFVLETGWPCSGQENPEDALQDEMSFDIVLTAMSIASHKMISLDDQIKTMNAHPSFSRYRDFAKEYTLYKNKVGKLDFTDMLERAMGSGPIPGIKVMFVDEAQDLSARQWKLVHEWAKNCEQLIIAGDDDQAIYGFMGGSEYGFLEHPADEEIVLTHSYRCPLNIGNHADRIIKKVKKRKEKAVEWRDSIGEDDGVYFSSRDYDAINWSEIYERQDDLMVLVRHRKQGYEISRAISHQSVPHVLFDTSVLDGDLANAIKTYFRFVNGGDTGPMLAKMFRKMNMPKFEQASKDMAAGKPRSIITPADFPISLPSDARHLFARNERTMRTVSTIWNMVRKYGIEVFDREPNIKILTYHGCKGKEADNVFLFSDVYASTWNELLKDPSSESRLAYVGVTRAKRTAYIFHPKTDMYLKPLLLEI